MAETIEELNAEINMMLPDVVAELITEIRESWKSYIQQLWYNGRIPSEYYDRTSEVLNSLTASMVRLEDGAYTCEVYYDTDKIHVGAQAPHKFPAHSSVLPDHQSFVDEIANVIEYGNLHGGHPIIAMEGIDAIDRTYSDYKDGDAYLHIAASILQEKLGVECRVI